uniref:G_PROTEIN_RECEP_F1_2 domain-containing protein n=1 Tax=Bursaphelenchus xylophilus TaxID=6326 RepID=A0A1I7SA89_BURXY
MDVDSNITSGQGSSFNYSFDYSDFDSKALVPKAQEIDNFTACAKTIIGVLTVSAIVVLTTGITRSKNQKFFGFQCYSMNLAIINVLNIVSLYCNDRDINLSSFLTEGFAKSIKIYNYAFKKTASIVFCTTTFFLIYETTQRYRRNIIGFPLKYWLIILITADFVPLLMTTIEAQYYRYSSYRPNLVALYQFLWLQALTLAVFVFNVAIFCMSVRKKREENFVTDPEPSFLTRRQMIKFCVFVICTTWLQYPTNYLLPTEVFDFEFDPEMSLKLLPTIQPYIKRMIDFHVYLTFLKPFCETMACLLFLCTK